MRIADADIVFVPGADCGPDHWMERWRQRMPTAHMAGQPRRSSGCGARNLVQLVARSSRPVILIAHGEGVMDAVHHAPLLQPGVRGAFLVAPRDRETPAQEGAGKPDGTAPFTPLPFRSLLVASRTDPALAFARAERFAAAWGSLLVDAGEAGRLDAASGHGPWPEGLLLLSRLLRNLPA